MLTLAIPFHSNPSLLRLTLASVERQTSQAWEVVVCDDSLEGEALSVVEELNCPRITWIRNPNSRGITHNWNFALGQVKTELFSLLHADDELEPEYVKEMISLAERFPDADLYYCRTTVIDQNGKKTFSFPDYVKTWIEGSVTTPRRWEGEEAAVKLLQGNFIFCPTIIYRQSKLRNVFDERFSQVMDLNHLFEVLEGGGQIVSSPDRLYRYRRHSSNLTAQKTNDHSRFREEISLYLEWKDRFRKNGWLRAEKTAREMRILKLHLLYQMLQDCLSLKLDPLEEKLSLLRSI